MDYRVEWSPEAVEDIEAIADFIARDSEFYAHAVVTMIIGITRSLPDFPMVGHVVPELDDESIREKFVYSYRLIYRIEQERILIVAVVHGKRLLESILERFKDIK